jgi:hypothetical protein
MFEEQLKDLPPDPPRSLEALPGLRLKRAVQGTALLFPFVFAVFFISVPLSIMRSDPAMRFAISPTRSIQAHVVSSQVIVGCRTDKAHRVIYEFSPSTGETYRGAATLCETSLYYSVKEGGVVEVQYLTSDPVISRMRGNNPPNSWPLYLFFFTPVFILAMFASLLWPPVREYRRARKLFQHGRLAIGTVLFVKKRSNATSRGWSGNTGADVFIQFPAADGKPREGHAWCPNDWLVDQLVPGGKVHVAYDEGSDKVALLEMFLR